MQVMNISMISPKTQISSIQSGASQTSDKLSVFADLLSQNRESSEAGKSAEDNKENSDVKEYFSEHQNTKINFKIHKETGHVMIQIIDDDTGKILREYPPEKILDSIAEIWKNAGINVDQKA